MLERQVYRIPKLGSIDHLNLVTETLPPPGADEVCIRVKAIGLNFADIFSIQGLYPAAPKKDLIPGLEFSGEVIAVGSSVSEWKAGDRVMGVTKFGAYVSHINLHRRYVIPLPSAWSFEEGAGFLVQGLTAFYALTQLGNLQRGMTVLIHSAAGGVGIMANRICKKYGAYTIGTVGNSKKLQYLCEEEAYDEVIVRDKDFYQKLLKVLGDRELLLVMDCIGGKILEQGWKAMAPMGRMIAFGSASFAPHGARPNYLKLGWKFIRRPKIDPMRITSENKSLMGFNLIYLYEKRELLHEMLHGLFTLDLKPQHIGQRYSFEDLRKAIYHLQSGETIGKVVVQVGDANTND